MRDSPAYKTCLAFVMGATTSKKARNLGRLLLLQSRKLLFSDLDDSFNMEGSSEDLLSVDHMSSFSLLICKESFKKSRQETNIHQAGGLGDGTGSKPGVPDESKGKDEDADFQHDDDEDALENKESEDTFVHTLEDYLPTDDETHDENNDVDEEEYERINEEMYSDVTLV
nr:hypothetical protein [Tanacetum cinerariifolium]